MAPTVTKRGVGSSSAPFGGSTALEVRRWFRSDGRPEHAVALTRGHRDVELCEAVVGVRSRPDADGATGLDRSDEDAERRRRPLELTVDLVDERATDETRHDHTGHDEHDADRENGGNQAMPQRHGQSCRRA